MKSSSDYSAQMREMDHLDDFCKQPKSHHREVGAMLSDLCVSLHTIHIIPLLKPLSSNQTVEKPHSITRAFILIYENGFRIFQSVFKLTLQTKWLAARIYI